MDLIIIQNKMAVIKKPQNDQEFIQRLNYFLKKYAYKLSEFEEGKRHAIFRLIRIKEIITKKFPPGSNIESFANFLPFLECEGGPEFLESEDGKEIIELYNYFSYDYKL
jgi:hypothetical protein